MIGFNCEGSTLLIYQICCGNDDRDSLAWLRSKCEMGSCDECNPLCWYCGGYVTWWWINYLVVNIYITW